MCSQRKPGGLFQNPTSIAPFICLNGTEDSRLQSKETSQHLCSRDGCKYNFHPRVCAALFTLNQQVLGNSFVLVTNE